MQTVEKTEHYSADDAELEKSTETRIAAPNAQKYLPRVFRGNRNGALGHMHLAAIFFSKAVFRLSWRTIPAMLPVQMPGLLFAANMASN
jgi:hypothetical protein